jgi:hypothetical protein
MNPSSLSSSSSSSSTSLTSSCPAQLSTVIGKVNLVVSNRKNASIIFEFHNYMQEKGSSENQQVNKLKVVMDFARYLSLIGDRSIRENEFGSIQKDREQEMQYWSDKPSRIEDNDKDVKSVIVAANNHYAGFGAATANMFRVIRGLPSVEWGTQKQIENITELQFPDEQAGYRKVKQKTLLDYISD